MQAKTTKGKTEKTHNAKCWRGCGANRPPKNFWWARRRVPSLPETVKTGHEESGEFCLMETFYLLVNV